MKKSGSSRCGRILTTDAVERLATQLVPRYSQSPAGAAVRRKLQAFERNFRFTRRSRQVFEELLGRLGIASTLEISLCHLAINPSGLELGIRWRTTNRRRHCPNLWMC